MTHEEHVELMRSFGAQVIVRDGGELGDPDAVEFNFGVSLDETFEDATPSLYEMFPKLQGKWDGKSTVSSHAAARKVLGGDQLYQLQPSGTCGGRAGSHGGDLLQTVLIAGGKRAKFKRLSHAWLYFLARREGGMLRGGDGVPGGSIPPVMAKYGVLTREESGDANAYGPGSDDLAVAWGGGRLSREDAAKFEEMARDNLVTVSARIRGAEEGADAIAAGGVIVGSDSRGFTMTRDSDGFCRPSGTWHHYHVRSTVGVAPDGRRGFGYDQSWGKDTPQGPRFLGLPGNCFGVEWDVQDGLFRSGSYQALFAVPLWELEEGGGEIPWIFM